MHKSGTSSLHYHLKRHPNISLIAKKEVHYFNTFYGSTHWYRSNFPTKKTIKKISTKDRVYRIGEATPEYLFHSLAPKRVYDLLPDIKLIVVLRNPIDRAYSHYNKNVKNNLEAMSFEDAITIRKSKLKKAEELIKENDVQANRFLEQYAYIEKGRYVEQFERWFKFFPKENFFVVETTNLNSQTFEKMHNFLGLPEQKIDGELEIIHKGKYKSDIKPKTREMLADYFKPYNKKLEKLLDMKFNWD